MILKNKFLFILLLIPLSFNGLSQNLKPTFSLNGYVKYLPAYMDYSFFESENNHLIHNRVNMRGYFGNNLSLGLEIRNRVFLGDIPTIQTDEGLIDMSYNIFREEKFVLHSMIDRF